MLCTRRGTVSWLFQATQTSAQSSKPPGRCITLTRYNSTVKWSFKINVSNQTHSRYHHHHQRCETDDPDVKWLDGATGSDHLAAQNVESKTEGKHDNDSGMLYKIDVKTLKYDLLNRAKFMPLYRSDQSCHISQWLP